MPYVTSLERYEREEQLKEGLNQGISQGLSQGLSQGITRGIEVALKLKFGPSALGLLPEIRAIEDKNKLEAILDAIETVARPEDLRRLWAE